MDPISKQYIIGTEYQLCSTAQLGFNRNGYDFWKWIDSNGNSYGQSDLCTFMTNTVDISAQWNPIPYGISYNLNGGSHSGNPSTYTIEDQVTFNNPTKTGYNTGKFMPPSIQKGTTGNLTAVASYSDPITYRISYELDGGTNGNNPTSYNIESQTSVLQPATKFQYAFSKWTENGNQITAIQKGSYGDKVLSANYIRSKITTRYHSNKTKVTVTYHGNWTM